ncbi:6,7-dimethyl-8-ribityllumazine synthase [Lactobacillus sp. DCY120]|uniref:6,7-dimethyl-8-ribityllumazine synthase n=1 Tax=Bombilactobacillus apium TaxID=2675299 RepID=A0A850QZB2_9LACO|nr:6,7-dimethyl-8-ribityllumazine synthase [Bombilactobacillus apium]NVY96109.1 6,7-dimethyl-8-ribityllumazine synthase [Bombilactobacillus apium]
MAEYLGQIDGHGQRIGIVVAQFNSNVTQRLLDGALTSLAQYGVAQNEITVVWVPGALEIPRAAQQLSASGKVDGIIALGSVIRGETSHYDYVCQGVSQGIAELSLHGPVPVLFGVLTTDNFEQAINRAGGKAGNKGSECVTGVLQMIHLGPWLQKN